MYMIVIEKLLVTRAVLSEGQQLQAYHNAKVFFLT